MKANSISDQAKKRGMSSHLPLYWCNALFGPAQLHWVKLVSLARYPMASFSNVCMNSLNCVKKFFVFVWVGCSLCLVHKSPFNRFGCFAFTWNLNIHVPKHFPQLSFVINSFVLAFGFFKSLVCYFFPVCNRFNWGLLFRSQFLFSEILFHALMTVWFRYEIVFRRFSQAGNNGTQSNKWISQILCVIFCVQIIFSLIECLKKPSCRLNIVQLLCFSIEWTCWSLHNI